MGHMPRGPGAPVNAAPALPRAVTTRLAQHPRQRTADSLVAAMRVLDPALLHNREPVAGDPLLHRAIRAGDSDGLLFAALALGADTDVRDEQGWTALHLAAAMNDDIAISMLLRADADVRAFIVQGPLAGWTPLHVLAHGGFFRESNPCAIALLAAGAEPDDVRTADGRSPSMIQATTEAVRC